MVAGSDEMAMIAMIVTCERWFQAGVKPNAGIGILMGAIAGMTVDAHCKTSRASVNNIRAVGPAALCTAPLCCWETVMDAACGWRRSPA
jgi:hypothetical protein